MARKTVEDLFIHELSDVYSAEKQITKALPRLAKAATNPLLAEAFTSHLEETQGQIERIDQLVELTGIKLKRMKCVAMEGLVEESKELLEGKRLPKSPCMTQNGISSPSESRRTADNPWPDLIRRHEKPRLSR